ncbi:hypothetical protein LXL04_016796 [Taraxacum kok-saghyz]
MYMRMLSLLDIGVHFYQPHSIKTPFLNSIDDLFDWGRADVDDPTIQKMLITSIAAILNTIWEVRNKTVFKNEITAMEKAISKTKEDALTFSTMIFNYKRLTSSFSNSHSSRSIFGTCTNHELSTSSPA